MGMPVDNFKCFREVPGSNMPISSMYCIYKYSFSIKLRYTVFHEILAVFS